MLLSASDIRAILDQRLVSISGLKVKTVESIDACTVRAEVVDASDVSVISVDVDRQTGDVLRYL